MMTSSFESRLREVLPPGVGVEPFLAFRDDLLHFNRGRNLVSRSGGKDLVEALILEGAAAGAALDLPPDSRVLDLGSGAGLPGIPFALARPDVSVVLLDRRSVACAFLRRERAALALERVEVEEGQAQELVRVREDLAGAFDAVLLKAVAPPHEALHLARPFLREGARAVLFQNETFTPPGAMDREQWRWEGPVGLSLADAPGRTLQRFQRR